MKLPRPVGATAFQLRCDLPVSLLTVENDRIVAVKGVEITDILRGIHDDRDPVAVNIILMFLIIGDGIKGVTIIA